MRMGNVAVNEGDFRAWPPDKMSEVARGFAWVGWMVKLPEMKTKVGKWSICTGGETPGKLFRAKFLEQLEALRRCCTSVTG